jgi:hypothetical protein
VARDLLEMSSHIFKPEVQRRLRQCLEAALPLGALPAAAAEAGRAVEEARYDEAVPVSGDVGWLAGWRWGRLPGCVKSWQRNAVAPPAQ